MVLISARGLLMLLSTDMGSLRVRQHISRQADRGQVWSLLGSLDDRDTFSAVVPDWEVMEMFVCSDG